MIVKLKFLGGGSTNVDLPQVPSPGWDVRWDNKAYSVVSVELVATEPLDPRAVVGRRMDVYAEPRAVLSVIPLEDTAP